MDPGALIFGWMIAALVFVVYMIGRVDGEAEEFARRRDEDAGQDHV